jgi:hypothetical protein
MSRPPNSQNRTTFSPLTKAQLQLVYGTLLGDGYMLRQKKDSGYGRLNPKLVVSHAASQIELVMAKRIVLGELVGSEPKVGKNRGWGTSIVRFETRTVPEFLAIHDLCYPGGTKTVTSAWLNMLEPAGMAWWFMDDGCRQTAGVNISTEGFSVAENELLAGWLNDRWAVEARIQRVKNGLACLRLPKVAANRFCSIIEPFMLPPMRYKLYSADSATCTHCGDRFLPRLAGQTHCSKCDCRRADERAKKRQYYYRNRDRILAGLQSRGSSQRAALTQSTTSMSSTTTTSSPTAS